MQQVYDDVLKGVSRYTNLLYANKKEDRDAISKFTDTRELRRHLFSKNQQETDTLPPTPDAMKLRVQRSNCVCRIWALEGTDDRLYPADT